jgi:hypothetical protein
LSWPPTLTNGEKSVLVELAHLGDLAQLERNAQRIERRTP